MNELNSDLSKLANDIYAEIPDPIPSEAYDRKAFLRFLFEGPDQNLECWYCETPIRFCAACGVPCLCSHDGSLCEDHVEDGDLISPEEAMWMYENGVKIPIQPLTEGGLRIIKDLEWRRSDLENLKPEW